MDTVEDVRGISREHPELIEDSLHGRHGHVREDRALRGLHVHLLRTVRHAASDVSGQHVDAMCVCVCRNE